MKNPPPPSETQPVPSASPFPSEYYAQLLFYAEADLEVAEWGAQAQSRFPHKPCFEARECAEKVLKAFLEAAGKAAPETHSLRALLRECSAIDKGFLAFREACESLTDYQFEARYPETDEYDFTPEEATRAAATARKLFDFVGQKVQQRQESGLM